MRKSLLFLTVILLYAFSAQSQGLGFEKMSYADALAKSKKEGKPVFIDFHTSWCRPCRIMEKEIFPLKSVGEIYNSNFINLEIDGEKGEGIELVKKYAIKNYPTFLFVDASGKVLYQFVGGRDEEAFIDEARRVSIVAKYGGWESFMEQYKSEKASPEIVWSYYKLAREEEKAVVMTKYLQSLPDEKLFDVSTGKLIENLNDFNFDLYHRLVDGLVARNNTEPEYLFRHTFPVQRNISKQMDNAIEKGDTAMLNKLLVLKKNFQPLFTIKEPDIELMYGRGLLFATTDFIKLTYDATNQENFETFKPLMEKYMLHLTTQAAPIDSTTEWKKLTVETLEQNPDHANILFPALLDYYQFAANHILLWTDYYWRNMPSTPEVRKQCQTWADYVFRINPYSDVTPIPAAQLMARLGDRSRAVAILDEAVSIHEKYNPKAARLVKNLKIARRDIENEK